MKINYLVPALALISFTTFVNPGFADDLTKPHKSDGGMNQVNEQFLKSDFKGMLNSMKTALMNHPKDILVQSKVDSLLERAYLEAGNDGLPAENKLASWMTELKVVVSRHDGDTVKYALQINGSTRDEIELEQMRVVHIPNQVILDKKAHIGDFDVGSGTDYDAKKTIWGESNRSIQKLPTGLYTIHIEVKGQEPYDTWVILDESMMSAPEISIVTPKLNEKIDPKEFSIAWNLPTDSAKRSFETQNLYVSLAHMEPPAYSWNEIWDINFKNEIPNETKCKPPKSIQDGKRYFVHVGLSYNRRFGEIVLKRAGSKTTTQLNIDK